LPAGPYSMVWTGTDEDGRHVASGLYLVRLTAGVDMTSQKMLLIR